MRSIEDIETLVEDPASEKDDMERESIDSVHPRDEKVGGRVL